MKRKILMAAAAVSLAGSAILGATTAANAAALYGTVPVATQKSSDGGAEFVNGAVHWGQNSSESPVYVDGDLNDVATDSAGPIFYAYLYNGSTLVGTGYVHNTTGSHNYYISVVPKQSGTGTKVVLKVCNGGSMDAPKACGATRTYTP